MIHASLRHRRRATFDEASAVMDLFSWVETDPSIGHNGGPPLEIIEIPTKAPASRTCRDCGTPISAYSRGRCEPCAYAVMRRPVPEDFTSMLKRLGSAGAAKHYRASLSTVTQWRKQCGIAKHERAKPVRFRLRMSGFAERPLVLHRDFSAVGQAADFLRRYGPVSRCDALGKYHASGTHWNRNGYVLGDDELMARAARLGWKAVVA